MEQIRRLHNQCKRDLITTWVKPGEHVLDCGCGRGGDLWKWRTVGAHVYAIDPDAESLEEAQERSLQMEYDVTFLGTGTIIQAAFAGPFDVVCYNFSIHYIVDDFEMSLRALACAVKPGGLLIGITPEKANALRMADEYGQYMDRHGNCFDVYQGGRRLSVKLTDGPFYAEGARDEPLLDGDILKTELKRVGFDLVTWTPMLKRRNGLISDLYSTFVFRRRENVYV